MTSDDHRPGERAPSAGLYRELNVFGSPTGKMALMTEGNQLPDSPRGFTWRRLSEQSATELRAQAVEYRRMAATATTADVATSLRRIADRFDALAERREREESGGA